MLEKEVVGTSKLLLVFYFLIIMRLIFNRYYAYFDMNLLVWERCMHTYSNRIIKYECTKHLMNTKH